MSGITDEGFKAWLTGRILKDAEWERRIGRLRFKYERRSKGNAMGRFGGGWDWKIGAQWSRTEVIVNLLVASLRVQKMPLCASCAKPTRPSSYKRHDGSYKHFHPDCWDAIEKALAFESVLPAIASEPRRILTRALNDKEAEK